MARRPLRVITYLAPSIPEHFFRVITEDLGARLGRTTELTVEPRMSGPRLQDDPFELEEVDVGFMCAPSLVLLHETERPSIELLPFAFVFADERAKGRPVYFSDVVVRVDSCITTFDDLRGRSWAYNDARSLSGWHSALERLRLLQTGSEFFSSTVAAGSHLESLRLIDERRVDAAAIDSTVLALDRDRDPRGGSRFRIIETWGPFPVQPTVVRASLEPETKDAVARHLAELHLSTAMQALEGIPFERFAPVTYESYATSPAIVEAARMLADDEHH